MKRGLIVLVALMAGAWFAVPANATTDPGTTGYIEVCKDSSTIAPGSATFQFTVGNVGQILVNAGECTPAMKVAAGTVRVHEDNYTDANLFQTDEWTAVTAIHTTAPGATDQMLVGLPSLTGRWADVTVNAAADASQVTVVRFTDDPVTGYFEICKDQVVGAGLAGQSFSFDWTGANGTGGTVSALVGACTFPIQAPAGRVLVEEAGTASYVDTTIDANGHAGIWTSEGSLIGQPDIAGASAWLGVQQASDTSQESILHFRNNSSLLKVCKVVPSSSGMDGGAYTFDVNGLKYTVHSFVKYDDTTVYGCVTAGAFRAGTSITVTELPQPGQMVDAIWLKPDRLFVQGGNDFTGQTATLAIQSGETEVFFKDQPADPQLLKICKTGGPAGGMATFNITGPTGSAPLVIQGSLSVTVPVGQCVEAGSWSYIGPVMIAEVPIPGYAVTSIVANGTPNRLAVSNPAAGTASVWIGSDATIVTYTNGDAVATATATTAAAGVGDGSSVQQSAATLAPVASTASVSTPTKVTAPAKVAKIAKLASVRIVKVKTGRYVVVRVNGTAQTVRLHLTLLGKNHKVLRQVTRYVQTNHAVQVKNLRLSPSVVSVRVAL